ncbi:MAG: hypothetical protein ABEK00_00885 [Candidatus Nanohaloarchaea archaeon]
MTDFREKEYWALHSLFEALAEYEDVDLEGTDYDDYGVGSRSVHRKKSEHKEAIRLISRALEEEADIPVTELETWDEDYDNRSYMARWDDREYGSEDMERVQG